MRAAAMPFKPAPTFRRRLRRDTPVAGAAPVGAAPAGVAPGGGGCFMQPHSDFWFVAVMVDSFLLLPGFRDVRDARTARQQRLKFLAPSWQGRECDFASPACLGQRGQ